MTKLSLAFAALLVTLLAVTGAPSAAEQPLDPENTIYMDLRDGRVVIRLRPDLAPNHVARIKQLTRQGFYDGVPFHRVIEGFMAQTGDPTGTGRGGPGYEFKDEFSQELQFNKPYLLGMANPGKRDANGSQFFITEGTPQHLTGKHTIFGLCEPASLVSKITGVKRGPRDKPETDVVMKKVTISRGKAKTKSK